MLKIGVDIDGTIRGLMESLIKVYKEEYPEHKVEPITAWDLDKFFPIGKEIYDFGFHKFAKEVFLGAEPYPFAIKALETLRSRGHFVGLLTYQNSVTSFWTSYWLHVYNVPYDKLEMWINDTSKPGKGKEFTDYDIFCDDAPKNIKRFLDQGKKVVRMNQPWNRSIEGVPFVNNMKEFVELIKKMEESNG